MLTIMRLKLTFIRLTGLNITLCKASLSKMNLPRDKAILIYYLKTIKKISTEWK